MPMQFEEHPSQELWTPSNNDDDVQLLSSSLTSLDFCLLDIDVYLSAVQTKTSKNDLIDDSFFNDSQCQEDFFSDFDFGDFNEFEEKSDILVDSISTEDVDIEKWISQSSFPSPPTDPSIFSPSSTEDASSVLTSTTDEFVVNTDMIVPPSPSISSTKSSSASSKKRTKMSANERKLRKKDQNKTAAEKYRLKKKTERHDLIDRYSKLKSINTELKSELEDLAYRVQQFKQLFSELLHIELPKSN